MSEIEMNREEQINNANPYDGSNHIYYAAMSGFKMGAHWTDKHPASPWISVEDRMPEDNQLVLTSSSTYGIKLLVWNDQYKVWDDKSGGGVCCVLVTHWMPIPEL